VIVRGNQVRCAFAATSPTKTLTAEDDDTAADTYVYDSDADAAAFGGDERLTR